MTLTQNVHTDVYFGLTEENVGTVKAYIDAPMTATWFNELGNQPKNREIVTSELIYYRMIAHNIPFECQKWHLNRLLTLIRVCNIKNQPPKKMRKQTIMEKNRAINHARRAKFQTKG